MLGVGVWRVSTGTADPGDVVTVAYLLTIVAFPIRSIGWMLGEFPRSVVGYERVHRVLDDGQRHDVRRRGRLDGSTHRRAPGSRSTTSATPTRPGPRLLDDLDLAVEPGRTVARGRGHRVAARAPSPRW